MTEKKYVNHILANSADNFCVKCKKRPRYRFDGDKVSPYCRHCINLVKRERYLNDPEYRKKEAERSRNYMRGILKNNPEYKAMKALKDNEYMKEYNKTERFSVVTIKSHMKRLSLANLDIVIDMLTEYRKDLDRRTLSH